MEDLTMVVCARCELEVPDVEAQHCWRCMERICWNCWERFGECDHENDEDF